MSIDELVKKYSETKKKEEEERKKKEFIYKAFEEIEKLKQQSHSGKASKAEDHIW